jgi:hypothetical protein
MNQRVLFFLLNLYSKGQALCYEITSKKLASQLSLFNPNQPVSLQFDILPTYQNSTRRSVLSSYPIYNIERMMIVLYKLAESLEFVNNKRYQNTIKASNLVLLKSLNHRGPKTDCFDKELKMISCMILLTKSADISKICAHMYIFARLAFIPFITKSRLIPTSHVKILKGILETKILMLVRVNYEIL